MGASGSGGRKSPTHLRADRRGSGGSRAVLLRGSVHTPILRLHMPIADLFPGVVPADWMQLTLLVVGWLFAFLLGKELSTGYAALRKRAAEKRTYRRPRQE